MAPVTLPKTVYITSTPTILAVIARYLLHGSPHPAFTLRDLIQAALFKRWAASALMPANDQSNYASRMATAFSGSVHVERVSLDPWPTERYAAAILHPQVAPAPVPAFFLTSKHVAMQENDIILYIHGGGYGRGDASGTGIASALSNRLRRRVCTIDYRLGTTAPFPAALQDCVTAYLRLLDTYDAQHIVLAGESAGAALCLALLLYLRDHHAAATLPRLAILMSPFMQTQQTTSASWHNFDALDFISARGLDALTAGYVALDPDSRFIQLQRNTYHALAPLFVSYGDAEVLYDDDKAFCEQAKRDGATVVEEVGYGKVHVWIALPQEQKDAEPVWQRMKQFVDGHVSAKL